MNRAGLFELNAVVAVATHRSFRRAATELGISPSALSHAIATLEQRMKVRLFNRTTRSVSLSEAGESFLARVRPALHDIAAAMEAVNEFRDTPSGTLRINTSTGAAQGILVPLVLEFLRRYPDMRVELTTEDRLVDIVAEGYDAGIRLSEAVPRDMIAVPYGAELSIAVVGSPAYLAYFKRHPRPTTPADLLSHNCIRMRFKRSGILRWQFDRHGEELAIDVKGSLPRRFPSDPRCRASRPRPRLHRRLDCGRRCRRRAFDACSRGLDAAFSRSRRILSRASSCAGGIARLHRPRARREQARVANFTRRAC